MRNCSSRSRAQRAPTRLESGSVFKGFARDPRELGLGLKREGEGRFSFRPFAAAAADDGETKLQLDLFCL